MRLRFAVQAAVVALGLLSVHMPQDARAVIMARSGEWMLREADIVARIRILDVAEHPGPDPLQIGNTKISQAEIVESIKGPAAKTIIRIEHDNGTICPSVHYRVNEEYLVFACEVPQTDLYVTLNYYGGYFRIENGTIEGYRLFDEKLQQPSKKADAVIADLRERLKKAGAK